MVVSEAAEDEGNLVICRRPQQGAAWLGHAPSLVQELLLVLRDFPTAARGTNLSNSKLWEEGKDWGSWFSSY